MERVDRTDERPPDEEAAFLSVEAAARKLGVSRSTVYNAVRDGELPSIRLRKRILVPRAPLDRLTREFLGAANEADP